MSTARLPSQTLSRMRRAAFLVVASLALLAPASAQAAPELGVSITRSPASVPANYEQVGYRVVVRNDASATPSVGDELGCQRSSWAREATTIDYNFVYQWLRDGERLVAPGDVASGSQTDTYTVQPADQGASLQCLVTGENPDTESELDGTTGHTTGFSAASSPRVIEPSPSLGAPTIIGQLSSDLRPKLAGTASAAGNELTCTAPTNSWTNVASATTQTGSDLLTDVRTATGTVTGLAVGSNEVTLRSDRPISGKFLVGQTVTIGNPGLQRVPAGTTIAGIDGNILTLSNAVTSVTTGIPNEPISAGAAPLKVGDEIAGAGIPSGATIAAITGRTVEISAPALATASGIPLIDEAAGIGLWSFEWLRNGVPRAEGTGEGQVVAASATSSTFRLSASEVAEPGVFQCVAKARNSSGAAVAVSSQLRTVSPGAAFPTADSPVQGATTLPTVEAGSATVGPVELEIELPGGEETRVVGLDAGDGANAWACDVHEPSGAANAGLSCERSDALAPEQSYPEVKVTTSIGADLEVPARTTAELSGGDSDPASAEDSFVPAPPVPFGIKSLFTEVLDEDAVEHTQAGGHPFSASMDLQLHTRVGRDGKRAQVEFLKDIRTDLPPGFLGNPQAAPQECGSIEAVLSDKFSDPTCPRASIVGAVDVDTRATQLLTGLPLYVLTPEPGVPAQLVFSINGYPVSYSLIPRLRAEDGYAISVDAPAASKNPVIYSVRAKLCGYGVNVGPSGESGQQKAAPQVTSCKKPADPGANPIPFLTNPTECTGEQPVTKVSVASWEKPNHFKSKEALSPPVTGCEHVPFEPQVELRQTAGHLDSPTGLDVSIELPTEGLLGPDQIATSALKKTVVTLPEGMSVNPSSAAGLGACAPGQIKLGTNEPISCPDASKLGTVKVSTPLLEETLDGEVYLATPHENPFGSLLALYLVIESKERGILVKIAGEVKPDPNTGRLTAVFDRNPQLPFERLDVSFPPGPRASLITPPTCGTHEARSSLSPWSGTGPSVEAHPVRVSKGPEGGGCVKSEAQMPNEPAFEAGTVSPIAASYAPFVLNLRRADGSQRFKALQLSPPPGLVAKLAGAATCPDATLASAEAKSGKAERQRPSCPPASELGSVYAGAGAGPAPFWAPGKAYLTGPHQGAPLSLTVITPAVAGPFDLGNVVIRTALHIDPRTARITAVSDPIPHILQGIPLDVREVSLRIDRPQFTLNPTSCEPMAVSGQLLSTQGAASALHSRFQLAECGRLGFKPRVSLRLFGATKRAKYQGLRAVVRPRPGDANIGRTVVRMPRSAFLAQEHIRTICTRVQWAADACPKGAVYGNAVAYSPLLGYPLRGSVYLRSSDNKLPDLVADLRGPAHQPIRIELVGRTDSVKGALRNTFDVVPDAPVSYFRLQLFGGDKGLIVNSRNICRGRNRAAVRMDAQNGRRATLRPALRNARCQKQRKAKRKRRAHRRAAAAR